MRALVIAPQPFFSPRGTPLSVYYRTLITCELGVKVDLLTYGEGQDVVIPGVRIIRIPRFAYFGEVRIGPSALKLFLDLFIMGWTVSLLLTRRYDFVHAHEEAVFFCRFLKPIFGFKLIYDMHSSLPQQLHNFQFTSSKFIIDIFRKLEKTCLRAADAVITICPDLAKQADELVEDKKKHLLIENTIFDCIQLLPSSGACYPLTELAASQVGDVDLPNGKDLIVYAGTLEPYQGIDLLIHAFRKVVEKRSGALLLVVGGNRTQVKHYQCLANRCGLDSNVLFTGRVSPSTAKKYCTLASVLISPRCQGTNTPLKIYEQLAIGKPLVATNICSHTQILNDDVAFLVAPDPEDMARGIIEALGSDGKSQRIVTNARRFYEQNYSRPVYVEKMRRLLELIS